ncbi:MAG: disulfide bond formation protein B [Anaplasma sp.]
MRRCGVLFLVGSVLALVTAYTAEMVFHLVPCKLCLYERVPYFAALLPSLINTWRGDRYSFSASVACYLGVAVLSTYHAGLEYGWFADFLHCAGELEANSTPSEMKFDLLNRDVVSCSTPSFVFLGLSLSGWNVAYAAVALFLAFALRKHGWREVFLDAPMRVLFKKGG